jgi:hypothetical protein
MMMHTTDTSMASYWHPVPVNIVGRMWLRNKRRIEVMERVPIRLIDYPGKVHFLVLWVVLILSWLGVRSTCFVICSWF